MPVIMPMGKRACGYAFPKAKATKNETMKKRKMSGKKEPIEKLITCFIFQYMTLA